MNFFRNLENIFKSNKEADLIPKPGRENIAKTKVETDFTPVELGDFLNYKGSSFY